VESAGADFKYSYVHDLIKLLKPSVLVHLSDESQAKMPVHVQGVNLYRHVPLVLRQHSIAYYRRNDTQHLYQNVVQLPLGYMTGMLEYETLDTDGRSGKVLINSLDATKYSLSRTTVERGLFWSFIGEVRGQPDRRDVQLLFSQWKPYFAGTGLKPPQMREMYNNSRFVLVGRGRVALDCFRIYEAIICGAIPVVIGSQQEIDKTFEFEGHPPPLLTSPNMTTAYETCRGMTNEAIDALRAALAAWYIDRTKYIMNKVKDTIKMPNRPA
jgi:hypothetical protein